jgi:transcriptional regulator with XRE-family HTH domain
MSRPSKFDRIDLEQVERLALRGWTDAEMAAFCGVTEQTWNNWKKQHPEFFESLKNWKAKADERVERSLFERAVGYEHPDTKFVTYEGVITEERTYTKHYPPDTTAAIFWLKNRKPDVWRDKQRMEVTGADGGPLEVRGRYVVEFVKPEGTDGGAA